MVLAAPFTPLAASFFGYGAELADPAHGIAWTRRLTLAVPYCAPVTNGIVGELWCLV